MPRGTKLTDLEKGQITAHNSHGLSERAIAKLVGRSRPAVHAFLTDPGGQNVKKRTGPAKRLKPAGMRRLLREARKGKASARVLKSQLNIPLSTRRIRELLNADQLLRYDKRKACPVLTKAHKEARMNWARAKVTWSQEMWDRCVFSDEKKFNLDGPDCFQYYWHDLRRDLEICSKRQSGGGSVMVWGAFCKHGKPDLVLLDGTQDAEAYVYTLSENLLPFIDHVYGRDCIFQQDNASIHSSQVTKAFFIEENVHVMEWPAKSPDLNPIENMWGQLARAVYAEGRQFSSKNDLIVTIMRAWSEIGQELIDNLLKSMPRRCVAVLEGHGKKTKY